MKELKEFDYFKGWLIFFLVATVGGAVLGIIIGSFVAAFMGAGGASLAQITRVNQLIGFVIAIPISFVTFRAVVGKYLLPKLWDDDTPPSGNPTGDHLA
jgi:integral membrane sensor domain MASE1